MSGEPPIDNAPEVDPLDLIFDKLDEGQPLNEEAVTFLRSEIRHLNEERRRLELNEQVLRRKLAELSDEITETANRNQDLVEECFKLKVDLASAADRRDAAQKNAEAYREENARLKASLASKEADLKLINSSLADIQKQLEAWKVENDAARRAIHKLEIHRESSGHPQEGTVKE